MNQVEVPYNENHHLMCPYCEDRSVCEDGQCSYCGARVVKIVWEPGPWGFGFEGEMKIGLDRRRYEGLEVL